MTITATADEEVGGITTLNLAALAADDAANNVDAGTATATDDYTLGAVSLTIDGGETTGTAEVTLTVVDDTTDEDNETIVLWDADGDTVGGKTYTVAPVKVTIIDDDDS